MPVDPKVIYLEADEEITSVVDKLRKTEFNKVILVVPKEASLLQSIVNLKLLKRQAENLNKSIALVTGDKVGRNLAEKVGIMTSAKINDDLKVADNYDLPEEVNDTPVEDSKNEDDGPLAETNEVVYKKDSKPEKESSTKTRISDDEEESIFIKEGDDELNEPDSDFEETEEKGWGKKKITEPEEVSLMPKFPAKKAILIGFTVLLVLLSVSFVFLPRAKATVSVMSEKKQVALSFKGEKDAKLDTEKAIIPAQVVETTKESSKSFQATGTKNIGEKATGTVKVFNTSTDPIPLATFSPAGHADLVYQAATPVTVNAGEVKEISVTAAQAGDQYNGYTNADFTAVKAPTLPVKSYTGMSGGSNKEVKYVTEGDISAAKDNLTNEAMNDARTEFNTKVKDLKVIDDSKKETTVSASANPDVNSQVDKFTVTTKVSIKAIGYNLDDVSELVKSEVTRQLGYSKQVIDDGSKDATIKIDSFDLENGTFTGNINANAYASNKLDDERIKTQLVGMTEQKAIDYLKSIEGVEEVKIDFWPSFIKLFPRLKNHVYLTIQVSDLSKDN